jgi:hypothetical protein
LIYNYLYNLLIFREGFISVGAQSQQEHTLFNMVNLQKNHIFLL